MARLGNELRRDARRQRDLQRMTEGRGGGLGKGRAQGAGGIQDTRHIDPHLQPTGVGEVTELVIDSTLLRRQQQQQ